MRKRQQLTKKGVEGYHLTFDLEGCDKKFLSDPGRIEVFIENMVAEIGMTKIGPVISKRCHSARPQDWGVSANVLIAESHIYTHTFPDKGCAWMDIFSCREIPVSLVVQLVSENFKPFSYQYVLKRRDLRGIE